jgi:hypothetical protein
VPRGRTSGKRGPSPRRFRSILVVIRYELSMNGVVIQPVSQAIDADVGELKALRWVVNYKQGMYALTELDFLQASPRMSSAIPNFFFSSAIPECRMACTGEHR